MKFKRKSYLERFCPPRPSRLAISFASVFLCPILRIKYGIHSIDVRQEELARLKKYRAHPKMLAPNHPSRADPAVIAHLARRANLQLFLVANREQFDGWMGWKGRLMQIYGAFSILRGARDIACFKMIRKLLSDHRAGNSVLIYPEGGSFSRHDSVFPFQAPVFSLVCSATELERTESNKVLSIENSDKQNSSEPVDGKTSLDCDIGVHKPLHIFPIAIRYVPEDRHIERKIERSFQNLEKALTLEPGPQEDRRERLLKLLAGALTIAEKRVGIRSDPDEDTYLRLEGLQCHILDTVESVLGLSQTESSRKLRTFATVGERIRVAINAYLKVLCDDGEPQSTYERTLLDRDIVTAKYVAGLLATLENCIDVRPGYMHEHRTSARVVDALMRLEKEIFGKSYLKVRTRCIVRVGQPLDVEDSLKPAKSKTERAAKIQEITNWTETAVQRMLDEMGNDEDGVAATL